MKHENIKTTRIIDEAILSYLQILEVKKEKKWEKISCILSCPKWLLYKTMAPRRRTLTVQESLRVTKLFYTLLELSEGEIVFNYYPKNEQALRQNFEDYDMHQLQPPPIPYTKTLYLLE